MWFHMDRMTVVSQKKMQGTDYLSPLAYSFFIEALV